MNVIFMLCYYACASERKKEMAAAEAGKREGRREIGDFGNR